MYYTFVTLKYAITREKEIKDTHTHGQWILVILE